MQTFKVRFLSDNILQFTVLVAHPSTHWPINTSILPSINDRSLFQTVLLLYMSPYSIFKTTALSSLVVLAHHQWSLDLEILMCHIDTHLQTVWCVPLYPQGTVRSQVLSWALSNIENRMPTSNAWLYATKGKHTSLFYINDYNLGSNLLVKCFRAKGPCKPKSGAQCNIHWVKARFCD